MDEFIDYYVSTPKKVVVEVKKDKAPAKEVVKESEETEQKVLITESTKEVVEEALGEKLEEVAAEEIVEKVNKSKKAVARRKKNGDIKVKRSING